MLERAHIENVVVAKVKIRLVGGRHKTQRCHDIILCYVGPNFIIPYSRKYWQFGPNWQNFNLVVKFCSIPVHISGSISVLSLKLLEQIHEFTNLQKHNWQQASAELAICTTHIEGCQARPKALLHSLCLYLLWVKTDFNLEVSNPDR